MFRIAVSPAYWWPVEVSVAASEPERAGQVDVHSFKVEFVRMGEEEFERFGREVEAQKLADRALAPRVMHNWAEVTGDDGASLPYTAANLAMVCDRVPGTASAIVRAFFDSRRPAAEKN